MEKFIFSLVACVFVFVLAAIITAAGVWLYHTTHNLWLSAVPVSIGYLLFLGIDRIALSGD